jgi:DNA repair protein RadC
MKQSIRTLKVRSESGALAPAPATYSTEFKRSTGNGMAAVADADIIDAALAILAKRVATGPVMRNMEDAKRYLALRFADLQHEVFAVLYLTARHRLIACEDLFRGTIDGSAVYPRIVVKSALQHNAAAVIISHNHPSGVAEPSQADELITARLREALATVDIRLLDHLVVAGGSAVSFAERRLL